MKAVTSILSKHFTVVIFAILLIAKYCLQSYPLPENIIAYSPLFFKWIKILTFGAIGYFGFLIFLAFLIRATQNTVLHSSKFRRRYKPLFVLVKAFTDFGIVPFIMLVCFGLGYVVFQLEWLWIMVFIIFTSVKQIVQKYLKRRSLNVEA